jgi:DNA (cytosine-5)-methyltransferase 1
METVAFCEKEPFPQKVLQKNFPGIPIYDDVCTLTKERLEHDGIIGEGRTIDIISGGFPCQPFSVAGQRKGKEDDRDLWPEMFRVIQELNPPWVVGENVANFINMELERTLLNLENAGYETQTFSYPACGVNSKQERLRTFVVAYSDSMWELQQKRKFKELGGRTSNSGEVLANTNSIGCDNRGNHREGRHIQRELYRNITENQQEWERWINRFRETCSILSNSTSQRLERGKNTRETSRSRQKGNEQSAGHDQSGATWTIEPELGRVAHGISHRVDRIKGLGNTVVPHQIFPILAAIKQINDSLTT